RSQVSQSPPSLTVTEGEMVTLHCNYVDYKIFSLQWYRQEPNTQPDNVMVLALENTKTNNQFSGILDKGKSSSVFNVSNSQARDSATYYCAV
ncbi:TVA2 protein, partial [Amia calva]|nr:TVA2 protein [Amia calva]